MTLYFRLKKGLRPEIFKVGHYRFQKLFSLGRNSRRRAGPLVRAVTRGALRTLKIDQFMLAMRIGTEDAALCALLCGALAGVIDAFLRVIPNEVRYACLLYTSITIRSGRKSQTRASLHQPCPRAIPCSKLTRLAIAS